MDVKKQLMELVRIRSDIETDKKPIIECVKKKLLKENYKVEVLPGDDPVIIAIANDHEKMFQGHLDTVPIGEGWSANPLGEIKDDKIYGRGTEDMKAGVAAMLSAVGALKRKPIIMLTTDEETGAFEGVRRGMAYLKKKKISPKICLNGEQTNFRMCLARKGVLFLDIIVKGKAAHGSTPEKGDNAIIKSMKILEAALSAKKILKKYQNKILGFTTMNIGQINGGVAPNVVPDNVSICVDIRPVQVNSKTIIEILGKEIEKKGIKKSDYHIKIRLDYKSYVLDKNKSVLKEAILKTKIKTSARSGFAENYYLIKAGIPAVSIGVRSITSHKIDECVHIKDLEKCVRVYKEFFSS